MSLDKGAEPLLRHVRGQVLEHAALAEQGMGTGLDGVGLEVAVHAEAFTGGAEQREQEDGEGVEQQQAVAALRVSDADCQEAHAEAQVHGISETRLYRPALREHLDDLRRGRVPVAGHQTPEFLLSLAPGTPSRQPLTLFDARHPANGPQPVVQGSRNRKTTNPIVIM